MVRSHKERRRLFEGTDPESYITEYTLVYEDYRLGGDMLSDLSANYRLGGDMLPDLSAKHRLGGDMLSDLSANYRLGGDMLHVPDLAANYRLGGQDLRLHKPLDLSVRAAQVALVVIPEW